ncbi:hypothetical protein AHAS_Ahas07G0135400 [Arachis hypogaea]
MSSPAWSSVSAPALPPPPSLPSSVISSPPVNSPTSSVFLSPSALRRRHASSESRSLLPNPVIVPRSNHPQCPSPP